MSEDGFGGHSDDELDARARELADPRCRVCWGRGAVWVRRAPGGERGRIACGCVARRPEWAAFLKGGQDGAGAGAGAAADTSAV